MAKHQASFSPHGEALEVRRRNVGKGDASLLKKCFYHGSHRNPPDNLCWYFYNKTPCAGCPNWRSCDVALKKKLRWSKTFIDYHDYQRLMRKKAWKDVSRSVKAREKRRKKSKPGPRPLASFGSRD